MSSNNVRLSIEHALPETIEYLNQVREKTTRHAGVFIIPIINTLLDGIHVLKRIPEVGHYDMIINDFIDALAERLPDLVVVEKHPVQ